MAEGPAGIYFAWKVFEDYATKGSLALKESVHYALDRLLAGRHSLETDLPAQGVVTLTRQSVEHRYIVHLLYASPVRRGESVEIIEDLLPLDDVTVSVRIPQKVTSVRMVPQGGALPYRADGDTVAFTVPRMVCHQMVELGFD
jgi:hypothetical protein